MDLEEIATHTGGVFRHTPQDLYRGLKQAMSLEDGSYTVGYYVTEYFGAPGGWDGVVTSGEGEPRYLVIFIDIEHDDKLRRPEAMADVERFVNEQLDPLFRTARCCRSTWR